MRFRVLSGPADAPWSGTLALAPTSARDAAPPWLLLNVSGPLISRLQDDPALGPEAAHEQRPVLLTDAQLDQVAGLIGLRGGAPIDLYATPSVFEDLTSTLPVLPELQRHCGVHWHMVPVAGDRRIADFQVRGHEGLSFTAFDTGPGSPGCVGDPASPPPGHSIAVGVRERASGRRAVFARGIGAMALGMLGALEGVDCLLLDLGPGSDAAADHALLAWLSAQPTPRKVVMGGSGGVPGQLAALGLEAAGDGCEIVV